MKSEDVKRFTASMVALYNTFDRQPNEKVNDAYFDALADLTIDDFERAAKLAIGQCRFFPKPVELRELIEGSADDKGQAAWELFVTAAARVGYYNSLWCDDASLASAIFLTFGGWMQACTALHPVYAAYERDGEDTTNGRQVAGLSPEMIQAERKKFLVNYRNARRENRNVERYLIGAAEANNRTTSIRRGAFPVTQPVGLIAGGIVSVQSLSFENGQIASGARLMLEQGEARKLLAAPKPRRLPASFDEDAPTMNLDEAIAAKDETLAGLEMLRDGPPENLRSKRVDAPRLTPEEIVERAKHLREQAKLLTKVGDELPTEAASQGAVQ